MCRTTVGDDGAVSPRLPMTLNMVLKAKADTRSTAAASPSCAEIARRWLAAGELAADRRRAGGQAAGDGRPAGSDRADNIDRIETNLQIAHAPKSAVRDFRTDYLLKVFDYDRAGEDLRGSAAGKPVRSRADACRRQAAGANSRPGCSIRRILPNSIAARSLIPKKFLATGAIAPTPVGFSASRPAAGVRPGAGRGGDRRARCSRATMSSAALKQAAERGIDLQNIRSVAGFERRLNDITCAGCHQTRGIGGFHFPGVDWMAAKPVQFDGGAGLAAFLRRPGPPPRYPDRAARRQAARTFPAAFPTGRNCAAARNSPAPNMRTAGARIVMPARQCGRQRPEFHVVDLRRRAGLPGGGQRLADRDVFHQATA